MRAQGLTEVATDDLKKLLSAVHKEHVAFPVDVTELTRVGLQHCALELMSVMRGLDANGVRAVLVAVIAERQLQEERARKWRELS